jgi:alpha-1,2-mannosyltransferase
MFAPFTALSRPAAHFVWVWIKLPLACLIFALATRIVERSGVRLTTAALLLIVSGWWLPVIVDTQEGQTNLLTLAPLVAGLALAQRESAARATLAGALIGLAAAIKLTPVAFIAYFIWRRRWRLVGAAVLTIAVCWLIVPAVVFGWAQNLRWFQQWAHIMIVPYVARGDVVYSTSQSVAGVALRLFSHALAFDSHHGGVTVSHFVNVATLDTVTIQRGLRVLLIATVGGGMWWMRKPLARLDTRRYVEEIAAVAAFMLWFSERTWVHHYVSLVLVLAAGAMVVSDWSIPRARRRLVGQAAVVFFVVTLTASEAGKSLGPDAIDWIKAYGALLFASIFLTFAVLRGAAGRSVD